MSLRELRLRAALSQAELALKAGMARQSVVEIESGRKMPYPSTIRKLAAALEVPPAAVLDAVRADMEQYEAKSALAA